MRFDKTDTVIASRINNAPPRLSRRNLLLASTGVAAASTFGSIASIQTAEAQQAQAPVPSAPDHYHPKGKAPSSYTIDLQKKLRESMPFDDKLDFEEAKKGFLAAPPFKQIMAEAGHVAWDIGKYEFLLQGKDFDSINPSLQRIAILNMGYGLYEVVPGAIFQVRGFDLANMSFIKSNTGWIIFDPLTAKETARAALDFINDKLGERPVVAVVYSHAHADHFAGVRGVVDEADVKSGKVKIIAPEHFLDYAVSENVMAGNAMNRRLAYQYGSVLPAGPYAHVDQSIGKTVAAGNGGLIAPNIEITKAFEELAIDGVKMEFQNTPGTESPAEMNTYFPDLKAFWSAENITATIHNIYTLRGAMVRDALAWSKNINEALWRYGQDAEVMFASHSWPRFGNARVQEVMRGQRDVYAHLNNYVLFLANQGVTINEVHNVYQLPKSLQNKWYARSYHGSEFHNSRAVINRYIGYWDCNPATLTPLSPSDSAPLYVEMMGGAEKIMAKGRELFDQGKYRHGVEILNKLVYAQPNNQEAKNLLADMFEQLGYQYESPSLRNSFLGGAKELRDGYQPGAKLKSAGPDVVRAMTTGLFLDFLGVRVDSTKAEGMKFVINLDMPDIKEQYLVEMSNATLTNIKGRLAKNPDLTMTLNRSDLDTMMTGQANLDGLVSSGKVKLAGNPKVLADLRSVLVQFNPAFQLMPGTVTGLTPVQSAQGNPFEQQEPELLAE
jgi:alkyl sulfatase BDS1-like metallo-beta-lactamase superfamily hydrolase